jgi:hypothetical protein
MDSGQGLHGKYIIWKSADCSPVEYPCFVLRVDGQDDAAIAAIQAYAAHRDCSPELATGLAQMVKHHASSGLRHTASHFMYQDKQMSDLHLSTDQPQKAAERHVDELALPPALPPALVLDGGDGVRIEATNHERTSWVIRRETWPYWEYFSTDGQWCTESWFSDCSDDFLARTRWPSAKAAWAALLAYRTRRGGSECPNDPDAMPLG